MASLLASASRPASSKRDLLERLYQERTLQHFEAGQRIPLREPELWVVARGLVTLTTSYASGDEGLLGLLGPLMPFGLPLSWVAPYDATALTAVDLLRLSMVEIERSPELAWQLFSTLIQRHRQAEALLALMGQRRVEDRLKEFLKLLGQEFGERTPTGVRLTVRLTHQHIANALGTTRVTVTRMLGLLRQAGWLDLDPQRHLVLLGQG
jgi:CRP-like cAMP-binding protein